ncbi:MAG: hypothetical protein R2911_02235 [Caldilineaceae bacterium]
MDSAVNLLEVAALAQNGWILAAAALIFAMLLGFILFERGFVRHGGADSATRCLIGLATVMMFYWLIGFGLMFGDSISGWGIVGWTQFAPDIMNALASTTPEGVRPDLAIFLTFQMLVAVLPVILIANATAGRLRLEGYLLICLLVSIFVYPLLGHWMWGGRRAAEAVGWLGALGFVDLAGASVIFSSSGWCTLALLIVLGPRIGRFSEDTPAYQSLGTRPTFLILGALLIWVGWFGLAVGNAMLLADYRMGPIVINLLLGGATGLLAIIPLRIFQNDHQLEMSYLARGLLAGLVAVSAGAHALHPQSAIMVSAIGVWIMLMLDQGLLKLKIDDAVGITPIALGAGIWGSLAVALFADGALLNSGLSTIGQFGAQLIGVFATGGCAFLITILAVGLLDLIFPFRVSLQDELEGRRAAESALNVTLWDLPAVEPLPSSTTPLPQPVPAEDSV